MLTKTRAVFLDRDGVINDLVDRGEKFIVHGKKVRFTAPFFYNEFKLREGVREALNELGKMGFLRILVTNQPDITYGFLSAEEHEKIMAEVKILPLDDIYICPHGRNDGCLCKKPKSGLLLQAEKKWNIDLQSSFVIGDSDNDIQAGKAAGCITILIGNNNQKSNGADINVADLAAAVVAVKNNILG